MLIVHRRRWYLEYLKGPILFNIFLSDLLLTIDETEFTSYAGGNTLHDAGKQEKMKMLSYHYRNLPKIFSNDARQFWKMTLALKHR